MSLSSVSCGREWTRTIDLIIPVGGTGCEPSGQKPLPLSSRIPDFANRVVSSRWVAVWTTVGLETPLWF